MSDISGVLNTARQAILSELSAINTTGSNIANVNTPSYSRLRPVFSTVGAGTGTGSERAQAGVQISSIERVYDKYLDIQLVDQQQNIGYYDTLKGALDRVEATINESSTGGLSDLMSKFWGAWNDVAANPGGAVERDVLVTISQNLASTFRQVSSELTGIQQDMNSTISDTIAEINKYSMDIAALNDQITQIELGGGMANDLRDKRLELMNKISNDVNVQFYESANGAVNVFLANGKALVEESTSWDLTTVSNPANSNFSDIIFDGYTETMNSVITGGALGGLLQMRDTNIESYMQKLDAMAENLVKKVNSQHRLGYDADGNIGGDFFEPVTEAGFMEVRSAIVSDPKKIAASASIDGDGDNATAIGAIKDDQMYALAGQITAADPAISATATVADDTTIQTDATILLTRGAAAADWTVTASPGYGLMNIVSADATTVNIDADGNGSTDFSLNLTGTWENGDTAEFTIDGNGGGAGHGTIGVVTATDADSGASSDHSATATINDQSEVYTATTSPISLRRGAAAGTWTIVNDGGYSNLAVLSANASKVVLDLNGSGTAALTLTLGGTWEQDDSLSFSLALDDGGSTLNAFYGALTGQIGQDTSDVGRNQDRQTAVANQLQAQRESVSGVAIDEEMMNLMKFQAAYNAAGKLSSVVNEMLNVLMNLIKS